MIMAFHVTHQLIVTTILAGTFAALGLNTLASPMKALIIDVKITIRIGPKQLK